MLRTTTFCSLLALTAVSLGLVSASVPTAPAAVPELGNSVEDRLTKSLLNCPLCAGSVPCMIACKVRGTGWEACLNECLSDNPIMRNMFLSMAKRLRGDDKPTESEEKPKQIAEEEQESESQNSTLPEAKADGVREVELKDEL